MKISRIFILNFLLAGLFLAFQSAPNVFGQSPTIQPSPAAEEESSPAADDTLDAKIKDLRESVKEKVREKLDAVQKGQKRAFVGEISEITNSTLILTTRQGEKQAKLSEDVKIVSQGKEEIKSEDLEIGNYIIAMGYLEDTDILTTTRVVVTTKPKAVNREVAWGKVTDISEENVLTVKNEKKGITYTVETTNKTKISKKIDGNVEQVKFSDIELGDWLVAIGTPTENEEKLITAKIIHVIPGQTKKEESEEETEEATSSAAPSPATKSGQKAKPTGQEEKE